MLWQDIPTDLYLSRALCLSEEEHVRLEAALTVLPPVIIDAHTHIARTDDLEILSKELLHHIVSTFPVYTIEMAEVTKQFLWPNKILRSARMAHAVSGYQHSAINDYLLANSPSSDLVIGFGLPTKTEEACRLILSGQLAALKMYFRSVEPPLRTVSEVFPDVILQTAEIAGVPIVLHLPTSLPDGLNEVLETATRYPRLVIILAHLGGDGGQFFSAPALAAFRALVEVQTVFMDTAFVYDRDLVHAAVDVLGPERILFGTDEPLSLIRGTAYAHPEHGPRLYAPEYHWAHDDGAPKDVRDRTPILLHVQMIEAIIDSVDRDLMSLQAIFHDNAERLFVRT